MSIVLQPDEVPLALQSTTRAIRILNADGEFVRLTVDPDEVIRLLSEGHEFGANPARTTVKYIKLRAPVPEEKPTSIWRACWRTCEAAVLPPAARFGRRPEQGKLVIVDA